MSELLWRIAAKVLSQPLVVKLLIKQATKTPYHHLASPDGQELYMARYWLLNPYDRETRQVKHRWLPWSARLHFIHREDRDQHLHDHPWNARTIILQGGYEEQRLITGEARESVIDACLEPIEKLTRDRAKVQAYEYVDRLPGDTAALKHGEYHRIHRIHGDCAVTLFITSRWKGPWGFLVDGVKVPWRQYLGLAEKEDLISAGAAPKFKEGEAVQLKHRPAKKGVIVAHSLPPTMPIRYRVQFEDIGLLVIKGQDLVSAHVCSKSPSGAHQEGLIKGDSGRSEEGLVGSGQCVHCGDLWNEMP